MPTDYELVMMSKGAYEVKPNRDPLPPADWYVLYKFYPPNFWDHGLIVYERIVNMDVSTQNDQTGNNCGVSLTRPFFSNTGGERRVVLLRVEWVIAFRGTLALSLWNWITNFGLFRGQTPPFSHTGIPRFDYLYRKLDQKESELVAYSLSVKEISKKISNQYNKQLCDYLEKGYIIERRVLTKTFTGHSLGANMAVVRACYEQRTEPLNKLAAIIRAVVFDSPGTGPMLNQREKQWADSENVNGDKNVVSYLSAPNVVNTLHGHSGQIKRLYVPHIKGKYLHFMNGVLWAVDSAQNNVAGEPKSGCRC